MENAVAGGEITVNVKLLVEDPAEFVALRVKIAEPETPAETAIVIRQFGAVPLTKRALVPTLAEVEKPVVTLSAQLDEEAPVKLKFKLVVQAVFIPRVVTFETVPKIGGDKPFTTDTTEELFLNSNSQELITTRAKDQ